jgi:D-serine dehydratase
MDTTVLEEIKGGKPVFWHNTNKLPTKRGLQFPDFGESHYREAQKRLDRYQPLLARLFPESIKKGEALSSPLVNLTPYRELRNNNDKPDFPRNAYAKCDNLLPIAGSIKARGGIYTVFKTAEELAKNESFLTPADPIEKLVSPSARDFFARHTLSVGSTGNLGLSIGTIGRALGFAVTVHMSREAKTWKKENLRNIGARVAEHQHGYTAACADARAEAEQNPQIHFIDDENSPDLFLGYSLAVLELKDQLESLSLSWSRETPLFLYLPCGVGGGPGGITFGCRQVFGDAVKCFFAEPVEAPSVLYAMLTPETLPSPVFELGLHLRTDADGLAVSRASPLAVRNMKFILDGIFTVKDGELYRSLKDLWKTCRLKLEPSGAAGFSGPYRILNTTEGMKYLNTIGGRKIYENGIHIFWITGGSMVPEDIFQSYLK